MINLDFNKKNYNISSFKIFETQSDIYGKLYFIGLIDFNNIIYVYKTMFDKPRPFETIEDSLSVLQKGFTKNLTAFYNIDYENIDYENIDYENIISIQQEYPEYLI